MFSFTIRYPRNPKTLSSRVLFISCGPRPDHFFPISFFWVSRIPSILRPPNFPSAIQSPCSEDDSLSKTHPTPDGKPSFGLDSVSLPVLRHIPLEIPPCSHDMIYSRQDVKYKPQHHPKSSFSISEPDYSSILHVPPFQLLLYAAEAIPKQSLPLSRRKWHVPSGGRRNVNWTRPFSEKGRTPERRNEDRAAFTPAPLDRITVPRVRKLLTVDVPCHQKMQTKITARVSSKNNHTGK